MSTGPVTTARSTGRFEAALYKLFTRQGEVAAVEPLGDSFRLVTITGPALRDVSWVPGQKLQVALGGWTQRTYTPMSWDPKAGSTEILAHLNGDHPGAQWARTIAVGMPCTFLGPRDSLDLEALERPALLFGDETSIGLAHALRHTRAGTRNVTVVLEVADEAAARVALDRLDLADATTFVRSPDDAHLAEIEAMVAARVADGRITNAVLSGKSTSIARLHRLLKRDLGGRRVKTRAYWAPGKKGLD